MYISTFSSLAAASDYGPFTGIVGVACALVAVFSLLLLKMVGRVARWTWLVGETPSFLVTAAARVAAGALMTATYLFITRSNYEWFAGLTVALGVVSFVLIGLFDRARRRFVIKVPIVDQTGAAINSKSIVIGTEDELLPEARDDLAIARRTHRALSLRKFLSGYGATEMYDPEALWPRDLLARRANNLTVALAFVFLLGVIVLFLAATTIWVAGHG